MATPQELLTDGRCFNCYGASAVQMMRLSLLSNLLTALEPTAMTDPQTLLTYGKCFNCYGASQVEMMELALLDQVVGAISGGGGGECPNVAGVGSPVGVVTPDCDNQFYRDITTPGLWQSTGPTDQDWIPWVGGG